MFSFFRNRREQTALLAAFEEAAAVGAWTLITLLEDNQFFFSDHPEELERAKADLDKGLSYSEQSDNHRAAYMHYISYISHACAAYPELVKNHPRLNEAVLRLRTLESETINPLLERQHKNLFPS